MMNIIHILSILIFITMILAFQMDQTPTHKQISQDYNISFGSNCMMHLHNSIDKKSSGYYHIRQLLIGVITDKNINVGKYHRKLVKLPPSLLLELRDMFIQLNIPFDWSWNPDDLDEKYDREQYPIDEESCRKWNIEKKYLFHWLDKAKRGEIVANEHKCTISFSDDDIRWITDAERIATLYMKNHI